MNYYYSPAMGPGLPANGSPDKPGIYPGGLPGSAASQQAQLTQMYGGAGLASGMPPHRGQPGLSQAYPGSTPSYPSVTYSQAMPSSSPYVTQGGLYSPYCQQGLPQGQQSGLQAGLPAGLQTGLPAGLHAGPHSGMSQPGVQPGLAQNPYLSSAGYGGMPGVPTSVYQGGGPSYTQAGGLGFPSHATPTYTYPGGRGVPSYPSHLQAPSPSYPSMGHPAGTGFPGGPPYGGRPL